MHRFLRPGLLAACLALVLTAPDGHGSPADVTTSFVDATEEAGLSKITNVEAYTMFAGVFPGKDYSLEFLKTRVLGALGGGIALGDLEGNGHIGAIVTRYNSKSQSWETFVLRNEGKGRFTDISESSGIRNSGSQISAAIGDFDNDALPDVYLAGVGGNTLYHNLGQGRFEDVTVTAKVADSGLCVSATFLDYDHDGDLDLYVCRFLDAGQKPQGDKLTFPDSLAGEANRLFRNNGNGSFSDATDTLKIGGGRSQHFGMVASDLDNDRDTDMLVINRDTRPLMFINDRDDRFSEVSAKAGLDVAGDTDIRGITVADFNRDGSMDMFLVPTRIGSNLLLMSRGDGTFERDTRSEDFMRALSAVRFGSGALDFDSDGAQDIYLFRSDGAELWRNSGDGRFVAAGRLPVRNGKAAASADFDGDGRADILYLEREGALRLLKNRFETKNHWLGIRLEGVKSNKAGFGATVEVQAGDLRQTLEVRGHNGYLSQDSAILWVGLGQAGKADSVTVRWPGGTVQVETDVAADQVAHIREPEKAGSCAMLYTWNGRGFEFITDILAGAVIGTLEMPGKYNNPDPDEYVRIEGSQLSAREGKYQLNLTNQLDEVMMFDQAQLLVVDHPAGTEIYPNERSLAAPPFPEYKIHTAREARPPVSAVDSAGADILTHISAKDRVYPDNFALLPFKGYAETHGITLDLGDLNGAKKVLLLMDGWTDMADSSSNLAASQAGWRLLPPYLQAKDAAGKWKTVAPSTGFPAGLSKTMTVDLTGKFLSQDYHVRIITNMPIYWDRIRVDTSEDTAVKAARLNPIAADLHFRGYPATAAPEGKLPSLYDYSRIRTVEPWGTHAGAYTRLGNVLPLFLKRDDEYVVMRHGDEVTVEFDASQTPHLQEGWVRDFLLYADGYGKDMDINSAFPGIVGPLPFHAMSGFPYSGKEKYDAEHVQYQKNYNTRLYPLEGSHP